MQLYKTQFLGLINSIEAEPQTNRPPHFKYLQIYYFGLRFSEIQYIWH